MHAGSNIPHYRPPGLERACQAAGVAPLIVLFAFVLIMVRIFDFHGFLAVVMTAMLWLIVETTQSQRTIDRYNLAFAARHLDGRPEHVLRAFTADAQNDPRTRAFVQSYLDAGRHVLPHGARP